MNVTDEELERMCKAHFEHKLSEDGWAWAQLPEHKRQARRKRMRAALAALRLVRDEKRAGVEASKASKREVLDMFERACAAWHFSSTKKPLHRWLGLTWRQYSTFIEGGELPPEYIERLRSKVSQTVAPAEPAAAAEPENKA